MNPIEVSIVVAAWNAEAFLQSSIESALTQEGVTIELIVADDASTDTTVSLVQRIAEQDSRVRVVTSSVNRGPAAARNNAISVAKGEWIAVLDADDRFLPGRLARLVSFAKAREADVAFDLLREVDEEGKDVSSPKALLLNEEENWGLERWIADNRPGRRELLTGYLKPLLRRRTLLKHGVAYREELRNSEDYALIAELLAQDASVWLLPQPGYLYTRRTGSISHRIGPQHIMPLLAFETMFAARLVDAGASVRTLQERRIVALKNKLALAQVIDGLRAKSVLRVLRVLAARPQAMGMFMVWIGEMVLKRTGLTRHA